ncbi:MAG: hypothetical protein JNM34_12775 [Chthonomonadaceae bacterium]|nr:hypothetical protein [Chthonomonadaceae bacterium]
MNNPVERLVFKLARHKNPFIRAVFGLSDELLARDEEHELREVITIERKVFGSLGILRLDCSSVKRAAKLTLASALGKRRLRPWIPGFSKAVANWIGFGPLLIQFAVARLRHRQVQDHRPGYCFLPAERYRDQAMGILGGNVLARVERTPRLTVRVLKFLCKAVLAEPKLLFYPEAGTNALRWLCYYEHVLVHYSPYQIANYGEGIASMSLVTEYCRQHGVQTVNLQHGELVVSRQMAFKHVAVCHFWSQKYAETYFRCKCTADQAFVSGNSDHRRLAECRETPRVAQLLVIHHLIANIGPAYLSGITKFASILGASHQVVVRRHPLDQGLWAEFLEELTRALPEHSVRLQNPDESPLHPALIESPFVIGATSAALLEAWVAGAKVALVPGASTKESAINPYSGSRNMLWIDSETSESSVREFIESPRDDSTEEWSKLDNFSLVTTSDPVPVRTVSQ